MDIKYTQKEIIDEKELCESLDMYREKLALSKREKILIKSEGKPDMVLLVRGKYEAMQSTFDCVESIEIEAIIKERVTDRKGSV